MSNRFAVVATAMLAGPIATVDGQVALAARITGKVLNGAGAPIARARVQTDATLGPQARPFSGPRNFSGTTNENGEWAILGVTRGVWIFEASAAGHVPQAVAVPVNMMHAQANPPVTWRLPLRLASLDELRAGGGARLADELAALVGEATMPPREQLARVVDRARGMGLEGLSLCAAGGMALVVRELGMARAFFERAEKSGVTDACAPLGLASVAMLALNPDDAVAAYDRTRSATTDKSLQQVMSAAIADLQKLGPTK